MGLLTPMIEKKDFLSVVATGFIVGLIGGGFLIAPVYDELPYVVGSAQQILSDNEIVNIEISTRINASELIKQINEVDGVISVENNGLFLETTNFSNERKKIIEEKIPIVDENFKSWNVDPVGRININITEGYDANEAIAILSEWLIYTAEIQTKYSVIKIKINVESNKINDVLSYLESREIVISSVEGPIQGAVENTKNIMVDRNIITLFMGFLGVLISLFGIYFDETIKFLKDSKEKIKIRMKELKEEIIDWLEELKEETIDWLDEQKEKIEDWIEELKEGIIDWLEELKEKN
jgi:hypothetical protein